MKLTYTGPHEAVDVLDIVSGREITVKRGETVELDQELAASLLEQVGCWRKVSGKKPKGE